MSYCRSSFKYDEVDWFYSTEDESESDVGSKSTCSTLSWTDEAEKEISEKMNDQYELFESALYSELDGEDLPEPLLKEVAIWKQYSPHLRITGTQINSKCKEIVEKYPKDYEEVILLHSDQNDITNNFKEQCNISDRNDSYSKSTYELDEKSVNILFDKISPDISENAEPIDKSKIDCLPPTIKNIEENKSFQILDSSLQIFEPPHKKERRAPLSSRGCITKHEYRCNHIVNNVQLTVPQQILKPPSGRERKLSPATLNRRYTTSASKSTRNNFVATSARLPKRKSVVTEFTPHVSQITENSDTGRHGMLPPIQTLTVVPKLPNKRANSAVVRFSKTLPCTRPNTSRNNALFLTPIDDSDNSVKYVERNKDLGVLPRGDGHLSPLASQLRYSASSKHTKKPQQLPRRWRY